VEKLIEERSKPWNPKMVNDPVQERLLDIIADRKKGRKRTSKTATEAEAAAPSNVVNIMDALRKSISSDAKSTKRR